MNQQAPEKPLPCPWCGMKPRVIHDYASYWVVCVGGTKREPCPVRPATDSSYDRAYAIAVWNYRPGDAKP